MIIPITIPIIIGIKLIEEESAAGVLVELLVELVVLLVVVFVVLFVVVFVVLLVVLLVVELTYFPIWKKEK